jgi:hypothetical protein
MGLKNLSNNSTISAIAGTVLGALLLSIISQKQPVDKIEYIIQPAANLINLPTSELNKTKLFNQKILNDLSRVDVLLYNRTGNVYKEVYFTFKINMDQKEKPILLGKNFIGPQGFSSNTSIHQTSEVAGEINYKVDVLNPSDDSTKYFKASFIFLGKNPPKIDVSAAGAGIEISNYDAKKLTKSGWILVGYVSIFYITATGLFLLFLNWRDRVRRKSTFIKSIEILKEILDQIDLNELRSSAEMQSQVVNAILDSKKTSSPKTNNDANINIFSNEKTK